MRVNKTGGSRPGNTAVMLKWLKVEFISGWQLIEEFPGFPGFFGADSLNSVADMDQHPVSKADRLVLQHEQADIACDSLGRTASLEAVDLCNLHRNG